jgi:hypothetical protein
LGNDDWYFAASTIQPDFFGTPFPRAGERVRFNPAALAAFGNPRFWPPPLQAPSNRAGLLVHRTPLSVLTWPCRLWRVHDLQNPRANDSGSPAWLPCISFEVVEELPSWLIFGPHGAAVADLFPEAESLTQTQVDLIAAQNREAEEQTRIAVHDRWFRRHHSKTASAGLIKPAGPVGFAGLLLSYRLEWAAARTGRHLFSSTAMSYWPELTDPSWNSAQHALYSIAIALGAPELLREHESISLTARWEAARNAAEQ